MSLCIWARGFLHIFSTQFLTVVSPGACSCGSHQSGAQQSSFHDIFINLLLFHLLHRLQLVAGILFTRYSRVATITLFPRAIYGTLSFRRRLILSALSNPFLCTETPVAKKSTVCQQTAFLSHITSHCHYLYHESGLIIFSLKLRARSINSK